MRLECAAVMQEVCELDPSHSLLDDMWEFTSVAFLHSAFLDDAVEACGA